MSKGAGGRIKQIRGSGQAQGAIRGCKRQQLLDFPSSPFRNLSILPATSYLWRSAMCKIIFAILSILCIVQTPRSAPCVFHKSNGQRLGSCAGQAAIFTITPTDSITSGIRRKDITPIAVWRGTMSDSGDGDSPIEIEIYARGYGVLSHLSLEYGKQRARRS